MEKKKQNKATKRRIFHGLIPAKVRNMTHKFEMKCFRIVSGGRGLNERN